MMPFDWSTLALQTINFVVLVWLLHRFLYKPVLRMIDSRRSEVEKHFAEAEKAQAQAAAHLAEIKAEHTRIAAERDTLLKSARRQADDAAKARAGEAQRTADRLIEDARRKIDEERRRAVADARAAALDLGVELARRLLAESAGGDGDGAWLRRIERHFAELPAAERDALSRQLADGRELRVVTAAALDPDAEADWRQRLAKLVGDGGGIAFAVDKALIAGAELHFPDAVLRFSWRDALAAMREELGGHADDR